MAAGSAPLLLARVLGYLEQRQQQPVRLEPVLIELHQLAARLAAFLNARDMGRTTAELLGYSLARPAVDLPELLHRPAEHRLGLARHQMRRQLRAGHSLQELQ